MFVCVCVGGIFGWLEELGKIWYHVEETTQDDSIESAPKAKTSNKEEHEKWTTEREKKKGREKGQENINQYMECWSDGNIYVSHCVCVLSTTVTFLASQVESKGKMAQK